MAFENKSWTDPPYDAKHGIRIVFKNGTIRYQWFRNKGVRNAAYKRTKKRVADSKFNETDVTKAERTI